MVALTAGASLRPATGFVPRSKYPVQPPRPTGHSELPKSSKTPWCELWLHATCCPAAAGQSHIRQSLKPAVPAPPVGPSPGFRAVASIRVVTSPNEVRTGFFVCRDALHKTAVQFFLLRTAKGFVKQKGAAKGRNRKDLRSDADSRAGAETPLKRAGPSRRSPQSPPRAGSAGPGGPLEGLGPPSDAAGACPAASPGVPSGRGYWVSPMAHLMPFRSIS
jgi:hypothetical protein